MTDMPEWRAWADRAHRTLSSHAQPKKPRNPRYACQGSGCKAKTTKNQSKKTKGTCHHCGAPLNKGNIS